MKSAGLYEFAFRGLLMEEALDRAGRPRQTPTALDEGPIAEALPIEFMESDTIYNARSMAIVYVSIFAFENMVRKLISDTLLEEVGEDWWNKCVSERVRKSAENRKKEEEVVRWHAQRGGSFINYTTLKDLGNIMRANFDYFEPLVRSPEWAISIFDVVERSRNVIMHSGTLDKEDVERLGINMRDWFKQVGS